MNLYKFGWSNVEYRKINRYIKLWYFSRRFFFVKMSSSSMWFFIPIYLIIISIKLLFNSTLFLNKWINSESFWTFLFFNDFVTRIFYNIINVKEEQFFMTRKKKIYKLLNKIPQIHIIRSRLAANRALSKRNRNIAEQSSSKKCRT